MSTHTHTHTNTDLDLHDLGKSKRLCHPAVQQRPAEAAHFRVSSLDFRDFLLHYPGRSSLCDTHSEGTYTVYNAAGALFLGTPSHQSLQEDSLKTGAGNPSSLSPSDTLEASCSEPALPRMLVKEHVSQRKMREWERQREREKEGEGAAEPAFWSGRDWDARL